MYVRLAPTAGTNILMNLFTLYATTDGKQAILPPYAQAPPPAKALFSIYLAGKTDKRLHVFGLREHIIRLNGRDFIRAVAVAFYKFAILLN